LSDSLACHSEESREERDDDLPSPTEACASRRRENLVHTHYEIPLRLWRIGMTVSGTFSGFSCQRQIRLAEHAKNRSFWV